MTKRERERQVRHILRYFQFNRVKVAMVALRWQWVGRGVPTVEELKFQAEAQLRALPTDHSTCGSGGFSAYWVEPGVLGLRFVVEQFDASGRKGEG